MWSFTPKEPLFGSASLAIEFDPSEITCHNWLADDEPFRICVRNVSSEPVTARDVRVRIEAFLHEDGSSVRGYLAIGNVGKFLKGWRTRDEEFCIHPGSREFVDVISFSPKSKDLYFSHGSGPNIPDGRYRVTLCATGANCSAVRQTFYFSLRVRRIWQFHFGLTPTPFKDFNDESQPD